MDPYLYVPDEETIAKHAAERGERETRYLSDMEFPEVPIADYKGNPIIPPVNLPGHRNEDVFIPSPDSLAEWLMTRGAPKNDELWACENVFKPGSLTLIVGAPMSFKSWGAFDLLLRAAEGSAWLDRPIIKYDSIVYVSNEKSSSAVYERLWKVFSTKLSAADRVHVKHREDRISFGNENWRAFVEWVHNDLPGRVLVVLDTLTSLVPPGHDENNLTDVSRILTEIRGLQQGERIDVVLVHHLNAMGERPRGHTALEGEVDGFVKFDRRGRDYDEVLIKFEPKDGTAQVEAFRFNADTGEFRSSTGRALHVQSLVEIIKWWGDRNNGEGITIGDLRGKFFTGHRWEQIEKEVDRAVEELALKKEERRYRLTNRTAVVISVMTDEERDEIKRTRRHVEGIDAEAEARTNAAIRMQETMERRAGRAVLNIPDNDVVA